MRFNNERMKAVLAAVAMAEDEPRDELASYGLDWDDVAATLAVFMRGGWDDEMPLADNAMALFITGIALGVQHERLSHELDGEPA